MASNVPALPDELWLYIGQFIDFNLLHKGPLLSVSRVFLEICLDARYHLVQLKPPLSDQLLLKQLARLKDPFVASYVRNLWVDPALPFDLATRFPDTPSLNQPEKSEEWLSRSQGPSPSPCDGPSGSRHENDNPYALLNSVITTLVNVSHFRLFSNRNHEPRIPTPFISTCWKSFGARLERLTLDLKLQNFRDVFPQGGTLVNLRKLHLRFSEEYPKSRPAFTNGEVISTEIAPFLKSVSSTIIQLSISSTALEDHSLLFHSLPLFPNLYAFSVQIGFYPIIFSDPTGLTRFLVNHTNNLQHLKIRPHYAILPIPSPLSQGRDFFYDWVQEITRENKSLFTGLHSFVLKPLCRDRDSTEKVLPLIVPRFQNTITRLIIGDCALRFDEFSTLLSSISSTTERGKRIRVLFLSVVGLAPQHFDLCASLVPSLEMLEFVYHALLGDVTEEGAVSIGLYEDLPQDPARFLEEMGKRSYAGWDVQRLWIQQVGLGWEKVTRAREVTMTLQKNFPSVVGSPAPGVMGLMRSDLF